MNGEEITADLSPAEQTNPPCQIACPLHTDIRGYVAAIARGDFEEGYAIAREPNPLVYVCAHVCAHPCEEECRRSKVDDPVAVVALKRFVAERHDLSLGHGPLKPDVEPKEQRVAIIGAGPAGLTAAYDLARMGYPVTVLEALPEPGGMLRVGLPKYRLPREIIDVDIKGIQEAGVEIKTGVRIGQGLTVSGIKEQGYEAVFIAIGAQQSRGLRIEGTELDGVLLGVDFLRDVNQGKPVKLGKRVLVIGGGNVAVDVARSAVRQGEPGDEKEVHMICLECREEMPAHEWEIVEAKREGIILHPSLGPNKILGRDGKVVGLETIVCDSVFDSEGRFNPSFACDTESVIEGDTVILAIGQASDLSFLRPEDGIELTPRRTIKVDPETLATTAPGVFAGGEVITGPGSVVGSMALGRRAAISIDAYLRGEDLTKLHFEEPEKLDELPQKTIEKIKSLAREPMPMLPLEERAFNYSEVERGYTLAMAMRAAHRCLTCGGGAYVDTGKCAACLTCVRACPYDVPVIKDGAAFVDPTECQACGVCASECPAKAITMKLYSEDQLFEEVDALFADAPAGNPEPFIVGFCCLYCAYAKDNGAESVRAQLPPNVRTLDVFCTSRIDVRHLLRAFERGADGVFVVGCLGEECRHTEKAANRIHGRVKEVQKLLDQIGLGGERLAAYDTASADWGNIPHIAQEMTERVRALGPNPL
jgi:formate dehydrogenase beta subunit